MYEALRAWCRAMNAGQVKFFLNGALLLAGASFLCLLLAAWMLFRRRKRVAAAAGAGMTLTALLSWGFLSLVLIQSGKILSLYYANRDIIPITYLVFSVIGVAVLVWCLIYKKGNK